MSRRTADRFNGNVLPFAAVLLQATNSYRGKRLPESGETESNRARCRGGRGWWFESKERISRSSERTLPTVAENESSRLEA